MTSEGEVPGAGAEAGSGAEALDLAALRDELAASPGAERLQPLRLGRVIEGEGALNRLADAVAEFPSAQTGVVVLAAATAMSVSGRDLRSVVEAALRRRFRLKWVTLGPTTGLVLPIRPVHADDAPGAGEPLHADEATVAAAAAAASGAGCVVTVGSGTITDIGKAVARDGIPLVAVQTAASVNGYADPFSVLLRNGVKRTTPTRWPNTLVVDAEILSGAPPELNRAGVGDLMAMFTASADWYLATVIVAGSVGGQAAASGGQAAARRRESARGAESAARGPEQAGGADPPYHAAVAGLTRSHGERLLSLAADLNSDPSRLAGLARILTLSAIAMGVAGSTAPASGMEHAVSHLLEMAAAARGDHANLHGTQVGVASLVATATWAHVRRRIAAGGLDRPAKLPDPENVRDRIAKAFGAIDPTGAMAAECFSDYARKLRRLSSDADPVAVLRTSWPDHDAELDKLLIEPGVLARGLLSAGLPTRFCELPEPVSESDARWAVANCMLMRQRFCVADLAMLIGGWQDEDVDKVLAEAGVLAGRP